MNDQLPDALYGARWRFERALCGWQHGRGRIAGHESAAPPDVTGRTASAARYLIAATVRRRIRADRRDRRNRWA